jgi:hypothetical protein
MEIKRSNLVLPTSGYELDEDEMSYVEGGAFSSAWVQWGIDIPLAIFNVSFFAAKTAIKLLGKGLAKKTIKHFIEMLIPTAVRVVHAFTGTAALLGRAAKLTALFTDQSDLIVRACSVGGLIATGLDLTDGSWDGMISW